MRAGAGRFGPLRAALPLCAAFYCLVCGFQRPLGGAVPCALLVCAWRGWRRVIGIADQGLVALLVRVAAGVLASQNGSFLKAALVQNRIFGVWCGSGLWRVQTVHF